MNETTLKLDPRTVAGKKVAKLRKEGLVPGVVYGGKASPTSLQAKMGDVTKAIAKVGRHTPLHLDIDGKKHLAIVKSVQRHPFKHTIRHVSFQAIKQNEIITTEVAIQLQGLGESEAERAGLIVLQAIESIEIKAKPADLPEALELGIDTLKGAEDKLTLGDIKLPSGVEFADHEIDLELVVANVYEPSALQAANEAAAGDAESDKPADEADTAGDAAADEKSE